MSAHVNIFIFYWKCGGEKIPPWIYQFNYMHCYTVLVGLWYIFIISKPQVFKMLSSAKTSQLMCPYCQTQSNVFPPFWLAACTYTRKLWWTPPPLESHIPLKYRTAALISYSHSLVIKLCPPNIGNTWWKGTLKNSWKKNIYFKKVLYPKQPDNCRRCNVATFSSKAFLQSIRERRHGLLIKKISIKNLSFDRIV